MKDTFQVDHRSLAEASEVTESFERQQKAAIEFELPRLSRGFGAVYVREIRSVFSSGPGLKRLEREIILDDVKEDLEDFGLLVAVADRNSSPLALTRLGSDEVPVLPPKNELSSFRADDLFSRTTESLLNQFQLSEEPLLMRPANVVRQAFFKRLNDFLAVRIAGVRWARAQHGAEAASFQHQNIMLAAGAGGGTTVSSENSGYRSLQDWTIHTEGTGYSIYRGGTHAVRTQPIYLNAPTTPIQVSLPMGTHYLAANAGPRGGYVWDNSIIEVPSPTPVYHTKAF